MSSPEGGSLNEDDRGPDHAKGEEKPAERFFMRSGGGVRGPAYVPLGGTTSRRGRRGWQEILRALCGIERGEHGRETLKQVFEFLWGEVGVFCDFPHRESINGGVPGNLDDANTVTHGDVLALADDLKSGLFQRAFRIFLANSGESRHQTVTSSRNTFVLNRRSTSGMAARYS